jgi:hypothetical protein
MLRMLYVRTPDHASFDMRWMVGVEVDVTASVAPIL